MKNFFKARFTKAQTKVQPGLQMIDAFFNPVRVALSFGFFLAAFGLGVILFPRFFAFLFGMFFLFFGVFFSLLAYKFFRFKKMVEARLKEFNKSSAIVVQQLRLDDTGNGSSFDDPIQQLIDEKKITWH